MSTVTLRNTNPLGYVDVPILGREGPASEDQPGSGCLVPGEQFACPVEIAGRAPSMTEAVGEPGDENYEPAAYDPGEGLLAQVGNYELVEGDKFTGLSIDELRDYAAKQEPPIDLGGATKKADILKVLRSS